MSTVKWIAVSALAGAAVVAVLMWTKPSTPPSVAGAPAASSGVITAHTPGTVANEPLQSLPDSAVAGAASAPPAVSPLDSVAPPACRTSARGDLVVDPQTRGDVEMVVAIHKPEQALAKLAEACKNEGAKAQQEMKNLYLQFTQYSQAVTQTFPVEEQTAIPVDKLEGVLLKGLHDLRVQYFGAEKACAMYCEEEALTKRMLAVAVDYKQKNPKASTEEAVNVAQGEILKDLQEKGPPK